MSSNLERMQELFPVCPICKSNEGYEYSAFIPDVRCKWCGAEWSIYEDGMELKRASNQRWDQELLGKKYHFDFWKGVKSPQREIKIEEKIFGPLTYVGGYADYGSISYEKSVDTDFIAPAYGYITLKPDCIVFESIEGSTNRMHMEVSLDKVKDIFVLKGEEISPLRWALIGQWAVLFKKKTQYLTLVYEGSSGIPKHAVFDYFDKKEIPSELMTLVNYYKAKNRKSA
jgi:hypothetical protein